MATFPAPQTGILLTHFIVSEDIARSRRFYANVLGGEVVLDGDPTLVALANGWIIINVGGPPTEDKPPRDAHRARPPRDQQLPERPRRQHPRDLRKLEFQRSPVSDPANRSRPRTSLLLARSRWSPNRGRPSEPRLLEGTPLVGPDQSFGQACDPRSDAVSDHSPVPLGDLTAKTALVTGANSGLGLKLSFDGRVRSDRRRVEFGEGDLQERADASQGQQ